MTKVKESIRTHRPTRRRMPSKGQRVGYLRVSSLDQNEVRQLEGLALNETFTDKTSGKDVKRPQLEAMQSFVAGSAARRWRGSRMVAGMAMVPSASGFRRNRSGKEGVFRVGYVVGWVLGVIIATIRAGLLMRI